jgi:hypothetical protein
MYADCVARINQFRACVCLGPLARNTAAEACADQMAQNDYTKQTAHDGFATNLCTPRGMAQNECPGWGSTGWGSAQQTIDGCILMMFEEGPGTDFATHGHYINMTSTSYTSVACGFYIDSAGKTTQVQNFF